MVISLAAVFGIAAAASSAGCRYQSMNTMGRVSAAPYTNLDCFEEGNPEGFSIEVPECECNAGMRLRYFASQHGADIHYEFESSFRDDDPSNDLRVKLRSSGEILEVSVGGRVLPPYDLCSDVDRIRYDFGVDSSRSMLDNYRPVMDDVAVICAEDQLDREVDRAVEEQLSQQE